MMNRCIKRFHHQKEISLLVNGTLILLYLFYLIAQWRMQPKEEGIAVLGFHQVVSDQEKQNDPYNLWIDSERSFREKIAYLYAQGYETWSLEELYEWRMGRKTKPAKVVVLTFDDGYASSASLIADILREYHYCGSVFVIGSMIADANDEPSSQFLRKSDMQDQSVMRYYSHTFALHDKQGDEYVVDMLSYEELQRDFTAQRDVVDCNFVAYPYGHYNDNMLKLMAENDVWMAFGYHENRKMRRDEPIYRIPRFSINAATGMDSFRAMLQER